MKNLKTVLAMSALGLATLGGLAACGSDSGNPAKSPTVTTEAMAPHDTAMTGGTEAMAPHDTAMSPTTGG